MSLRADNPFEPRASEVRPSDVKASEFEVLHRETAIGQVALYVMFVINILGFLALAAVLIDIAEGIARGQQAAFALMAQLSLLTGVVTVWAGLAVICGAVRYFNRRIFIRPAGRE